MSYKYFTFLLIPFLFSLQLFAENEKQLASNIDAVTVFLSGAQIERSASTNFSAGESTIILNELSKYVQSKSVQLDGKGNFTILSIEHRNTKKEDATPKTAEQISIEEQIAKINDDISFQQKLSNVYAEEKKLILQNWAMGGTANGVDVAKLKQAADFYRSRLSEIERLEIDRKNTIKDLQKKQTELNKRFTELQPKAKKQFTEVAVKIKAKQAGTASFNLSYFVNQAQWSPAYDVRMKELNEPLAFTLRANVYQNTNEDWDNVQLTLSTANPTQGGVKPTLYPQYVNFWENYGYNRMQQQGVYFDAADEVLEEVQVTSYKKSKNSPAPAAAPTVTTEQKTVATEYTISEKYTIKGEQGKQVVEIQQVNVPADYEHRAVPKLDKSVFLSASISDWESYGFMDGPMNLYLEGKYTGESYLYSQTTNDTLVLSLGRDKSVVVEREKIKDFKSKKFLGNKTTESFGYNISVRNKKNTSVKLIIEDQIPISQNEAIEVELLDKSKAKYDEAKGFLTWTFDLKANDKKEVDFKYAVKYPKKKRIVVR